MALRLSTGLKNKLLGKTVDLVTNGSFTSSTTGWSANNAILSSVTGGQSGNCLEVKNNSTASGYAFQSFTVKPYHRYLVTLYFKKGLSASGFIKIGTGQNDGTYADVTVSDTSWTRHSFLVQPTTDALFITLGNTSTTTNDTSLFDEVVCEWEASSLKEIFYKSKLCIYSGTQPGSADDTPTGVKLVEITVAGSGNFDLEFDEASNGAITKVPNATWSGQATATGTAGYFRLITHGDSTASSTTDCRIDGAIGSTAELVMADPNLTTGQVVTISTFKFYI